MNVQLHVRRNVALLAGSDEYGTRTVQVKVAELSSEHRAELTHWEVDEKQCGAVDYDLTGVRAFEPVEFTLAEVLRGLDIAIAAREAEAEKAARRAEEEAAEKAVREARKEEERRKGRAEHGPRFQRLMATAPGGWEDEWGYGNSPIYQMKQLGGMAGESEFLKSVEFEDRLKAEQDEVKSRFAARREAAAKEEALKQVAFEAWVDEHGSPRLRALKEEGFQWRERACKEFASHVLKAIGAVPADRPLPECNVEDAKTPTMEVIQALRSLRKAIESSGHSAVVNLIYVTYYETGDFAEDASKVRRYEAHIEVKCPDDSTHDVYVTMP